MRLYDVVGNKFQSLLGGAAVQHPQSLQGRAVQVDPMRPTLKAPGSDRLKL
jgi:hypothetical protein